ncbi:MAG: DUF3084 domain-containing protein [Alkalinema sp. RU_4_3]|nr:DUF3084 domain-containing protein [Alkalinema sp. RU_4_3]
MSSGYILILAVLILGGVIATLGDRIGTRVGKARLSLFNLRPKKTAVLVTILTGLVISASTIGVMLLASREFRDMLLNFDVIQRRLNRTKRDLESTREGLEKTNSDKTQVEQELAKTRRDRRDAQKQLAKINESLKTAVDRQRVTEEQRNLVLRQRDAINGQLGRVSTQAETLRTEISRLSGEQSALLAQRNAIAAQIADRDAEITKRTELIARRDRELADRNQVIASSELRLKELEQQQLGLQGDLARLTKAAQENQELLRLGTAAILRGQTLTAAAVKIEDPTQVTRVVDSILREANRTAVTRLNPVASNPDNQIIQIPQQEIEALVNRIKDGQAYAIRIRANANYILGETRGVAVFIDVARNVQIFDRGEILAAKVLDIPANLSSDQIQTWLNQLIASANSRALNKGLLVDSEVNIRAQAIVEVMNQLKQYNQPIEVRAIASEDTLSAGPLRLEFVIVQNGSAVLQTQSPS